MLFDLVYWVLTPLTFIKSFSGSGITSVLLFPFVALTANLLVTGAMIWRMKFEDDQTKHIVLIHSVNQNNLFIGYPVLYSAFGNATMALYFGLVAFVYTILVPDILGSGKPSLKTIAVNPVTIGFALGNLMHYADASAASRVPNLHSEHRDGVEVQLGSGVCVIIYPRFDHDQLGACHGFHRSIHRDLIRTDSRF